MSGRKQVQKLFLLMQKYFPGFSNARIRLVADSLGIRETRRIIGINRVSLQDALSGKTFADCISRTTYNFDLPDPLKPSYDPMMGDAAKPNTTRPHETIEVPFGAIVPKLVKNLLVTGRSVSVDREVLGALRVMGPCMLLGQAAGFAAAKAHHSGISFHKVNGTEIRQIMINQGCLLE
jgi:hypothetical protein